MLKTILHMNSGDKPHPNHSSGVGVGNGGVDGTVVDGGDGERRGSSNTGNEKIVVKLSYFLIPFNLSSITHVLGKP